MQLLSRHTARILVAITASLVAASACEPLEGFFEVEQAADDCPGATVEEADLDYHPRILRGEVSAPPGAQDQGAWLDGWLIGEATAAPLEEEQPVSGAPVVLYRVGPSGERRGELLRRTETGADGQWCMKLPEGADFGADLFAEATVGEAKLRRSVPSEMSTDIYSASEALTALLVDENVDFTEIPTATYFNMESIAATAIDLLEPVELDRGDGVEEAVQKIRQVLEDDERLMEIVRTLQ